ncbi:MAG: hypothetical protein K2G85_04195 [Muribaculaceae bacterium]|nr:hypothetical protein [Muribaculaceae bacterium]
MKKIFTLLSVAAVALSVSAETVILSNPGKVKKNVLSGTELGKDVPEGFTLQCMNETKNLESGSSFTIDGTKYVSIKLSNGAQNTLTLPEGYVATKLTFYTTINKDAATERPCYWKEVAGNSYKENDNNGIIESFKNFTDPNVQSFDIPNLNVVTFANAGEQPFIALEVTYEEATVADEDPVFPETIEYTINGEKELAGVEAKIEADGYGGLSMSVTGKSDAETITLEFALPEGWDGWIVNAPFAEVSEQSVAKTRSEEDWLPLDNFLNMEFVKGNTVTFAVEEEDNWATLALYKGDKVYNNTIDIEYNVVPAGGSEEPEDPAIPEELNVTVLDDGLTVTKEWNKWGSYVITIEGEVSTDTYDVVIDIPEGWDGFICENISNEKVIISENNVGPKGTRAEEYKWLSVEKLLADGYEKGNRFTFEPTYVEGSNRSTDVDLYLYKGDQAIADEDGYAFMYIQAKVTKKEGEVITDYPDFPETYEVTLSCEGPEVTQGPDMIEWTSVYVINVDGECTENELTVTVAVPEGWDGFYGKIDEDSEEDEAMTGTRGNSEYSYWFTPAELEEFGITGLELGNELTFNVDGESHTAQLYLTKGGKIAYYPIILNVNVMLAETFVAPEYPEMFTMTADPQTLTVAQVPYDEVEWTEEESEWTESAYADQVIEVSGETEKETVSLTFELPEGWAGVAPVKLNLNPDLSGSGDEDLLSTRANESEFAPLDEYLANYSYMPWFDATAVEPGTTLEFPANGEKQIYFCKLYISDEEGVIAGDPEFAGDYVDVANTFIIVVNVSQKESAVEGIDAVNADAVYYNVNGAKVANPAKGIYVKVVDGKATKVVVK